MLLGFTFYEGRGCLVLSWRGGCALVFAFEGQRVAVL